MRVWGNSLASSIRLPPSLPSYPWLCFPPSSTYFFKVCSCPPPCTREHFRMTRIVLEQTAKYMFSIHTFFCSLLLIFTSTELGVPLDMQEMSSYFLVADFWCQTITKPKVIHFICIIIGNNEDAENIKHYHVTLSV